MVMDKIRVGVVGAGIGKSHVEAFAKLPALFEVTTICDLDAARAQGVADEFGVRGVVNDIAALYANDELDVIDICTPSFLHYQQTLDALAAGKHVICEKPIAGSLQEADDLIAAEGAA
jgi:predicted dehydrogenase